MARRDLFAQLDDRTLVDARAGIAAHELEELVSLLGAVAELERDALGVDRVHGTRLVADDQRARVLGGAVLHAGADDRRIRTKQRHGLTLHVRAHERAVGVVVLEERNQRGRDRDDLLRRDVHELYALGRLFDVLFGVTADDRLRHDLAARFIDRRVGLRDDVLVFAIGRQIDESRR